MKTGFTYERISDDREGLAIGVGRQREDNEELAQQHGIKIVATFRDNDRGASTRSTKPRPEFEEMVRRARLGEVTHILAYSNGRLTRRPREVEDLIELAEKHGVQIVTKVSGSDDLGTADGRMVARIKGNVDAAEAERIGERTARAHLDNALNGRLPGGSRPFGWDRSGEIVEAEATLIRNAAQSIIAGATLVSIRDAWNAAGVETSRGSQWTHSTIKQMLTSPRLAGWRLFKGKVMRDGEDRPVRGQWEPILDQATHEQVVAALTRPDKRARQPRRGARRYLLSGIVRCATCSAVMYGNRRPDGKHNYACNNPSWPAKHGLAISGPGVDRMVAQLVFEAMHEEEGEVAQSADWDGEQALAETEQKIADLMGAYVKGTLSAEVVMPAVGALEVERDVLRAGRADWLADTGGPATHGITAEQWNEMDASNKRPYITKMLDAVLVKPPTSKRSNRLDLGRIEPVWRGGVPVPRAAAE